MIRSIVVALALVGLVVPVPARAASPVTVSDAYANPASGSTAIYATIVNSGATADRLIGAMTPNAASIELRDAAHGAAPVAAIPIPANGTVVLAPGGASLEVVGLKADVAANDAFLARLHFEHAGWVVTIVRVRGGSSSVTGPAPGPPTPVPAASGVPIIPVPRIAH